MSGPRRPRNNRQRVEDYYGVHDTGMGSRPAPAAPPAPPTVPPAGPPPQGPPQGQAAPGQPPQAPRRPRVIPPPEVQVAAKEAARAAAGAPPSAPGTPGAGPAPSDPLAGLASPSFSQADSPAPEAPRTKPDPLTDPLTSETFQGVQPASDTYEAGVVGGFGYSASTGPQTASNTSATAFDGSFDQFAPPRFEPRAEGRTEDLWADPAPQSAHEDGETLEATFEAHPESETLDEPDESYIDVEVVDVEVDAAHTAESEPEPETEESAETEAAEAAAAATETADPVANSADDEAQAVDDGAADDEAAAVADPVETEVSEVFEDAGEPGDAADADDSAEPDDAAPAEEPARPTFAEPLAIDPYPYTQIDETYVDSETLQNLQNRQAPHEPKDPGDMTEFNESLNEAMTIDGALGVALVDASSGMALATAGDPAEFNLEVAAAGNSALVQAMSRTLGDLDLDDHIEDILITLGTQYQIVRPINQGTDDLFLYLVLDRSRANLAMARFRLTKLAEQIEV
ncbi:roadblock/LC7 domain-containing protein [Tsukamurella sp. USMM236]|uniref:roadblock/LC7 domain-containing protein n=1 Tax=Tsukamurella sp. USMM236 TaxID=3081301 RepID=UPI00301A3F73